MLMHCDVLYVYVFVYVYIIMRVFIVIFSCFIVSRESLDRGGDQADGYFVINTPHISQTL